MKSAAHTQRDEIDTETPILLKTEKYLKTYLFVFVHSRCLSHCEVFP